MCLVFSWSSFSFSQFTFFFSTLFPFFLSFFLSFFWRVFLALVSFFLFSLLGNDVDVVVDIVDRDPCR